MRVYATGDRSLHPHTAIHALSAGVLEAAEKWGQDIEFVTGSNVTGIEAAMRYMVQASGGHLDVFAPVENDADGNPKWDEFYERVKESVDAVLVIHPDPFASKSAKSIIKVWNDDDERVLIVSM